MLPPAFDDFDNDPIGELPSVHRVYKHLKRILDFREMREVKTWPLAEQLKLKRSTVRRAFLELLKNGYLRGRAGSPPKSLARLRLVWSRTERQRTKAP